MFAVSLQDQDLSPIKSSFHHYWIYDLQVFHPFWINKIKAKSDIFFGESVWDSLLKAMGVSFFSDLKNIEDFSKSYHQYFNHSISSKNRRDVFAHFRRIGITKVGHLKKIPPQQIQRRFGKHWAEFFKGICFPKKTEWKWQAHKEQQIYKFSFEPEYILTQQSELLHFFQSSLEKLASHEQSLCIETLQIDIHCPESEEEKNFHFYFPHKPLLSKEKKWIQRSVEERLRNLEVHTPIYKLVFSIQSPQDLQSIQLHLFQNQYEQIEWKDLIHKLQSNGFNVFQPEILASHLPEGSWRMSSHSIANIHITPNTYYRPLIQHLSRKISAPSGKLYFTERIEWVDTEGEKHQRNYFITHSQKRWVWVFQNENQEWYQQGIVE